MTIKERIQAPTPPFFKKLRNIALILAAISGTLLAAPAALPAVVIKIAGYMAVAGTVAGTVSQTATATEEDPNAKEDELQYRQ